MMEHKGKSTYHERIQKKQSVEKTERLCYKWRLVVCPDTSVLLDIITLEHMNAQTKIISIDI